MVEAKDRYKDKNLHDKITGDLKKGSEGGPAGMWNARKAVLLKEKYIEQGGEYADDKDKDDGKKASGNSAGKKRSKDESNGDNNTRNKDSKKDKEKDDNEEEEPPKKRGRGRPPKDGIKAKAKNTDYKGPKRGRGRPRKNAS